MKNELYKAIKAYCEENHCWGEYNTAKEWNEYLGTSYGAGTFTALVSAGLLVRTKGYKEKSYSYALAPTAEMLQKRAEEERQSKISLAKYRVEHHDEEVAEIKERYEEMIREAEEWLKRNLEWEAEKLAEAQELLKQEAV